VNGGQSPFTGVIPESGKKLFPHPEGKELFFNTIFYPKEFYNNSIAGRANYYKQYKGAFRILSNPN